MADRSQRHSRRVEGRRWPISRVSRTAEAIVYETLRLYPPAYALGREAIVPIPQSAVICQTRGIGVHQRLGGPSPSRDLRGARRVPAGALARWALAQAASRRVWPSRSPRDPGSALGAGFAMQEMVLALATIASTWQLRPADAARVRAQARRHPYALRIPSSLTVSRRARPARAPPGSAVDHGCEVGRLRRHRDRGPALQSTFERGHRPGGAVRKRHEGPSKASARGDSVTPADDGRRGDPLGRRTADRRDRTTTASCRSQLMCKKRPKGAA